MRALEVTVLFYEGPIARAYLQVIHALGFQPTHLVQMACTRDVASGKPVGRFLPQSLRAHYALQRQKQQMHHWPNLLRRRHAGDVARIMHMVEQALGFPHSVQEAAHACADPAGYAARSDIIKVSGIRDPAIPAALAQLPPQPVLFTGGGIVPAEFLGDTSRPWIHVHPGYLPDIRGADGLLWSLLLKGRPSASVFHLAAGIDTGNILLARWLPELPAMRCDLADAKMRYRAVYSFIDPWVRAYALAALLREHGSLKAVPVTPQDKEAGTTYRFMPPETREQALHKLFSPAAAR